ncbi:DUF1963 domain-containing protein [Xanthomonas theicola]|uniref:DUF1963 domain-containing protein n=1 Tax=Xanthomonas theicola TaxID=56464 RepID=UPI0031B63764
MRRIRGRCIPLSASRPSAAATCTSSRRWAGYWTRPPPTPHAAAGRRGRGAVRRVGSQRARARRLPEFTQEDPRKPQDAQVLRLQLDSDQAMMWGDSGIADFFIDPADLHRGDFSPVAYNWDCY